MSDSSGSKILTVGILAEVHNIHPLEGQDADSAFVLRQVVDTPYAARPGTTEIEPSLFATPLELSEDGGHQVYRADLRSGVKFWDGSDVTPADIVACLEKVPMVMEQSEPRADGGGVAFHMKLANAGFQHVLSHSMCGIYKMSGGRLVGTGPFRLAATSRPEDVRLERNEHYHGSVLLDGLRFVTYPSDEDGQPTALLRALEAGEAHFSNSLSKNDIGTLSGVRKSFLPGIATAMLYLNTESPKLRDTRLRRAIAHSIDRIEVARTTYTNALAFAASSILPRTMGAADDELSFDPSKAAALLAEDGVDAPESLSLLVIWGPRPYLPYPQRFVDAITEQLAALGIRVEAVQTATSAEYLDGLIQGRQDMTLGGWIADTMDPYDFLESSLASSRVPSKDNIAVANNNGRLASAAMDKALADYRADHGAGHLERILQVMSDEAPLVPLCYGPTAAVWSFRVQNFKPSPLSIFPFVGIGLD